MTQSTEQRLRGCTDALVDQGVKDVKFYFASLSEKPLSVLAQDTVEVLDAILESKYKALKPLDDTQRK